MDNLSPRVLEKYVAYKKSVLSKYNLLLDGHNFTSVGFLMEELSSIESQHKKDIESNKSIIGSARLDFSNHLALTPIHELPQISKAFKEVITLREQLVEEHFGGIIKDNKFKEPFEIIKATEKDIYNQLKIEKNKYHL
jgi:hypothetical protein